MVFHRFRVSGFVFRVPGFVFRVTGGTGIGEGEGTGIGEGKFNDSIVPQFHNSTIPHTISCSFSSIGKLSHCHIFSMNKIKKNESIESDKLTQIK